MLASATKAMELAPEQKPLALVGGHGNEMIPAAPCSTLDVLLTRVAFTASRAVRYMLVGTTQANPVAVMAMGSAWSSLKAIIPAMAPFRAALNSSVVGSEVSVALSVSLLLWPPESPDTWAVLKKDTPS